MRKNKLLQQKICILLLLTLLLTAITGCGDLRDLRRNARTSREENDDFTSLGLSPEFDYEVPESLPSIMVDQLGYAVDSNKIAMINGDILDFGGTDRTGSLHR